MADNPFAKYAAQVPGTSTSDDNPFARFRPAAQASTPAVEAKSDLPEVVIRPDRKDYGIDWSQPAPAVRSSIAKLPDADRAGAYKQWADAFVEKEHADSPISSTISDKFRQLARGTPVGSWLDELSAAAPLGSADGSTYDERKAYQDARDRYADDNSTKLGTLHVPFVDNVDVTTGDLTKLAGGLLSAPLAPGLAAKSGSSLFFQAPKAAAAGAGYGALYGAGEGSTASERIGNAGSGAVLGGVLGALATTGAAGVGNVYQRVSNALRPNPAELRGVSRRAIGNVVADAEGDGLFGLTSRGRTRMEGDASALGPQGMLADMGGNLREHAGGLATKPGIVSEVRNPIEARGADAGLRLDAAATNAMGPALNVPVHIERMGAAYRKDAKPLFESFYKTPVKPSENLNGILDRAKAAGAYDEAATKLAKEGFDPHDMFYKSPIQGQNNAGYNARFLDAIKRSLQDGEKRAIRTGADDEARVLGNIKRDLLGEVDSILSPNNPAQSIWARARGTAREHLSLQDAFDRGQGSFKRKLTYNQMVYDMRNMTPDERSLYRLGARAHIAAEAEAAGTKFGPADDTSILRTTGNRAAQKKIEEVAYTPEAGRQFNRVADAERRFAATEQDVLRNSKTAARSEQGKRYQLDANDTTMHNLTMEGIVFGPAKKLGDMLVNGAMSAHRIKTATDAARMLVAQGVDRDQIIKGLIAYRNSANLNHAQRYAITRFTNNLINSARSPAIDARATR